MQYKNKTKKIMGDERMKTMIKQLPLLLLVALMITVLAACSNAPASSNASSAKPSDGSEQPENVSITFGFWGDAKESQMKMDLANLYMETHPNVKIDFTYTDGASYLTKLQTWFTANEVPDVFGVASDHLLTHNDPRFFEDLTPYVQRDNIIGEFAQSSVDAYTFDGKLHALPYVAKTFAIAYNKDLFDQAQLAYPTADWTEEDMWSMATALTKDAANSKQYGMRWGVRPPEFYRNLYGNPVYSLEDKTINAAGNKEFEAALTLFSTYIKEGISPDETASQVSSGGFETGIFGMQLIATWDIASFQDMIGDKFKWDVVELPNNTQFDKRMKTTYRGNGWSISKENAHKEASWDFIKWMSTNEQALEMAQRIGVPELSSYTNSDAYMNDFGTGTAYDKGAFIRMIEHSVPFGNAGVFGQVNDMMKIEYDLLIAGKHTISEAIEKIQKKGEQIFKSQS
jgi:multiple sugar transport system substrate-binding protein